MPRKTIASLEADLKTARELLAAEKSNLHVYAERITRLESEMSMAKNAVAWHKQMNQQLVEVMLAGSKEGAFPRRHA